MIGDSTTVPNLERFSVVFKEEYENWRERCWKETRIQPVFASHRELFLARVHEDRKLHIEKKRKLAAVLPDVAEDAHQMARRKIARHEKLIAKLHPTAQSEATLSLLKRVVNKAFSNGSMTATQLGSTERSVARGSNAALLQAMHGIPELRAVLDESRESERAMLPRRERPSSSASASDDAPPDIYH